MWEVIVLFVNCGFVEMCFGYCFIVCRFDYEIVVDKVGSFVGYFMIDWKGVWNFFEICIFMEIVLVCWVVKYVWCDDFEDFWVVFDVNWEVIGNLVLFDEIDVVFYVVFY